MLAWRPMPCPPHEKVIVVVVCALLVACSSSATPEAYGFSDPWDGGTSPPRAEAGPDVEAEVEAEAAVDAPNPLIEELAQQICPTWAELTCNPCGEAPQD